MHIQYPGDRRSVVKISHNADYFFRMGHESARAGEMQQAISQIDKALQTDPDYAAAWHEKGNCLDEIGRCEEAVSCFDKALELDPYNAETWFNKGLTLKKMGKGDESSSCINHGIDLALGR
ncbi:MAG: tetratricopeptide repeat protein [Methanoregulaceae archaeon]|jgi:Flp pilus assembly protein TadD|nr:tetratricopeptide repeat protein [Methanoregulaceae archaeon]